VPANREHLMREDLMKEKRTMFAPAFIFKLIMGADIPQEFLADQSHGAHQLAI
jgi:hypothetical protein